MDMGVLKSKMLKFKYTFQWIHAHEHQELLEGEAHDHYEIIQEGYAFWEPPQNSCPNIHIIS